MSSKNLRTFTMEDIQDDPHKYGAPTFEEFLKMRDPFKRKDSNLIALDGGPLNFRDDLKKIRYFINGKESPSLEHVERVLSDCGYTEDDIDFGNQAGSRLKFKLENVPVGGGLDHEVHVSFFP